MYTDYQRVILLSRNVGYKGIRGSDDLSCDAHCLKGSEEGECTVSDKTHVGHIEVVGKNGLQLLMERTVIGDPLGIPDLL